MAARAESASPGIHIVQAGDTLLQIALDANVDMAALAKLNGLDQTDILAVGETLKLPAPAPAATAAPAPAPAPTSYTVTDGDNLWDIAQHFNTTTDAIMQLNHMDDGEHLSLGQVLSVPGVALRPSAAALASAAPAAASASSASAAAPAQASAASGPHKNVLVSYTVQPGETLSQIARQFDVRTDTIVQASNLDDPNRIGVGSVVKVPVPAREHVVTDGETLRDIASTEKVDLGSLIDFNAMDDPEMIHVGQVVLLPVAASQQAAAAAPAPKPVATATPSPTPQDAQVAASKPATTPTPSPSPSPTPQPAATTATPTPTPAAKTAAAAATPTPKPAAPVAVVAPPAGAPTDGLAGAGLKFLGSAYVWGGSSPTGFDCSGFVWYVARQQGKQLSRGMFGQYNSGSHPAKNELQIGDLVFFQNTFTPGLSHNGIYIGNGQFVHAADESAGVTISSLNTAYWSSHWFGATRLP
jgi:cell wall-associated NlpC family hydrolase/nucleoid-associated protein YgaU